MLHRAEIKSILGIRGVLFLKTPRISTDQGNTRQMRKWNIFFALLLGVVLPVAATAGDLKYKRYINARFAYGISYPEKILIPQGEADNGDGQEFISKDQAAKMVVYGSNNAVDDTLGGLFKEDIQSHTKESPDRVVTYKLLKKDWYVISGTEKGRVFYKKTFYSLQDNQFIVFLLSYPESQRTLYDPITAEIGKSMRLLPRSLPHTNYGDRLHDSIINYGDRLHDPIIATQFWGLRLIR
jgi:hypothetical protein